jgi:hypothetical protein
MEIALIVTFLIIVFIFAAFIIFSDNVKGPEKFVARVREGSPQIASLEIFDASNKSLFYYTAGDDDGDKKVIVVPNCASFMLSWKDNEIVGVGPFTTHDGRVIKTTLGMMTSEMEPYTNTNQIKR